MLLLFIRIFKSWAIAYHIYVLQFIGLASGVAVDLGFDAETVAGHSCWPMDGRGVLNLTCHRRGMRKRHAESADIFFFG